MNKYILTALACLSLISCSETGRITQLSSAGAAVGLQLLKQPMQHNAAVAMQQASRMPLSTVPDGNGFAQILAQQLPESPAKALVITQLSPLWQSIVYPYIKGKTPQVALDDMAAFQLGLSIGSAPYAQVP